MNKLKSIKTYSEISTEFRLSEVNKIILTLSLKLKNKKQ